MKHRIVEITKADGSKQYRCERTGFFFRNHWRVMGDGIMDVWLDAVFDTIEEALRFLGIHNSQIIRTEKVIWER